MKAIVFYWNWFKMKIGWWVQDRFKKCRGEYKLQSKRNAHHESSAILFFRWRKRLCQWAMSRVQTVSQKKPALLLPRGRRKPPHVASKRARTRNIKAQSLRRNLLVHVRNQDYHIPQYWCCVIISLLTSLSISPSFPHLLQTISIFNLNGSASCWSKIMYPPWSIAVLRRKHWTTSKRDLPESIASPMVKFPFWTSPRLFRRDGMLWIRSCSSLSEMLPKWKPCIAKSFIKNGKPSMVANNHTRKQVMRAKTAKTLTTTKIRRGLPPWLQEELKPRRKRKTRNWRLGLWKK